MWIALPKLIRAYSDPELQPMYQFSLCTFQTLRVHINAHSFNFLPQWDYVQFFTLYRVLCTVQCTYIKNPWYQKKEARVPLFQQGYLQIGFKNSLTGERGFGTCQRQLLPPWAPGWPLCWARRVQRTCCSKQHMAIHSIKVGFWLRLINKIGIFQKEVRHFYF
jgi:hypothetical protein